MGTLVTQAQAAYATWKASLPSTIEGLNALSSEQILANWRQEQVYLQAIKDAQDIEDSFFAARNDAFANFDAAYRSQRSSMEIEWQRKEDAGFDVDA